jgi:hypothetical protein
MTRVSIFFLVSDLFKNTWKTSRPCPEVLRVYKIVENKGHAAKYEKFRYIFFELSEMIHTQNLCVPQ